MVKKKFPSNVINVSSSLPPFFSYLEAKRISNSSLDIMYDKLKSLGALGGKVVGAGGGGFFLMVVDKNQNAFRKKVIQAGNIILDFKLDFEGAKIIY